jgi:hypothetical protein
MNINNLSEADKYLLYGLLLKKPRSGELDRKALAIVRNDRSLDEKIEAILDLQAPPRERGRDRRERSGESADWTGKTGARQAVSGRGSKSRGSAVVIDMYPKVTRLLRKCSLKRVLDFTRVGESFDVIYLLRTLDVRLIIVNDSLPPEECSRYYEICRAIEPRVRIIYLLAPPENRGGSKDYRRYTRFIPKPINIDLLDRTARELLSL